MKKNAFKSVLSIFMALVLAFSCLTLLSSSAGSVTIVKQPSERSLYEGIDWTYAKDKTVTLRHDIDLTGTVLKSGTKTVEYKVEKWANMYVTSDSGKWTAGSNSIRIYCDDFSDYAVTTAELVAIKKISVAKPPVNTVFVKGLDWEYGLTLDVQCSMNLTGLTLDVTYVDGKTKTVSYPENELISWGVSKSTDYLSPGDATVYAYFCGFSAPFDVQFVTENPYKKGDVSKDGAINSFDALLILQHSTEAVTLDYSQARLADINGDKKINSLDALKILQHVVGIIDTL